MTVALIQLPYDSGHRETRMGRGPGHLVAAGAPERIRAAGEEPVPAAIHSDHCLTAEIATGFELAGKLAGEVTRARRDGAWPLVLAGNCLSAVGAVAGLHEVPRLGVIWLDAHGDLNTPETTLTGFLDGMALGVTVGWCFRALAKTVPGFEAVEADRILHAGGRAWDAGERALFTNSGMGEVPGREWAERGLLAMEPPLSALARQVDAVYLHIDMDVHDAGALRANPFASAGGPSAAQVRTGVQRIAEQVPIVGAGITALDPACDTDGAASEAALELIGMLATRRA
ncbi:arginase [Limimonas halophila]|uniref:Arginase n=1 Tax=Limimonas halophila TaxID=1082479 RepID=A0A1G7S5S2_9PROT|nr:arginase family protein [Limimonas halophila]SDG18348.1 arginase [Limimonas halophila]